MATSPELSILLSSSKVTLSSRLAESPFAPPEGPSFTNGMVVKSAIKLHLTYDDPIELSRQMSFKDGLPLLAPAYCPWASLVAANPNTNQGQACFASEI